ncbi:MAG: glycosyltransferase family 4 protein [Propionibacteriaceae bacterium]
MTSRTTLIISNDFPPHVGGIETFVATAADLLDGDVVVLTGDRGGAPTGPDPDWPYPVHRRRAPLLPTRAVARQAADLVARHRIERVLYGAAAPLGLLASRLWAAGVRRQVALSHGHEVWWATLPGSRTLLRRIGAGVDHLTTISAFTEGRVAPALAPADRARLVRLPPPVDLGRFRPDPARRTPGRCVAVGRLVRQKGIDTLITGWSRASERGDLPAGADLVVLGDGPQRRPLARLAQRLGVADSVRLAGAVPHSEMITWLQGASVFALPVRTRFGGLIPEGLGLAFVEAAACGLPVLVGDSGGAPETVRHGETGWLVDGNDPDTVARALAGAYADPAVAAAMGAAGRELIRDRYGTETARRTLRRLLDLEEES